MSSKTTNLGLIKPSQNDYFDIDVLNENMDKIDTEMGSLTSSIVDGLESMGTRIDEMSSKLQIIFPLLVLVMADLTFSRRLYHDCLWEWQGSSLKPIPLSLLREIPLLVMLPTGTSLQDSYTSKK